MKQLLSVLLIAVLSATLSFANDGAGESAEAPNAFKSAVRKSALEVKNGFVKFGRTMKTTGRQLKDHVVDSFRRDKAKIRQDFQHLRSSFSGDSKK
jgi:hypothetical protein